MRASVCQGYQVVQRLALLVVGTQTIPGLDHGLVGCDENSDRLIGHAIEGKDVGLLVQTPLDQTGLKQLRGPGRSRLEARVPCRGDEVDTVCVLRRQLIDNG